MKTRRLGAFRSVRAPGALRAVTLLETLLALSLTAMLSLAGVMVVRTSWQAFDIQDRRSERLQQLSGAMRHITRHLRMCREVVEVSDPTATEGYLTISLPDTTQRKWAHDSTNKALYYGVGAPTELLAGEIEAVKFECFEQDGVTQTTVPEDVRMIRVSASTTTPVQNTPWNLTSTVWFRKQQDALEPPSVDFYAGAAGSATGWLNPPNGAGSPNNQFASGTAGQTITLRGFDTSGYSGNVETVVVGLNLKTLGMLGSDWLDVQIRDSTDTGPVHSFHQDTLQAFNYRRNWFWVDVTDDLPAWTYESILQTEVELTNRDAGNGGSSIELDAVMIRTFEATPSTQTSWASDTGNWANKWLNDTLAIGPPDGTYASSDFESVHDQQSYAYPTGWADLGAIIRVHLLLHFCVQQPFSDDVLDISLHSRSGGTHPTQIAPITWLNQHVGLPNAGTSTLDFTNLEEWTWPSINKREIRMDARRAGGADGTLFLDAIALQVRYVAPQEPAIVVWEEL